MKVESPFLVLCFEIAHRISWHWRSGWDIRYEPTVWCPELKGTVCLSIDLVALLVDRAVVPATQHREIRQRGRPAFRPVAHVMTFAESYTTAWKAPPAVSVVPRAS